MDNCPSQTIQQDGIIIFWPKLCFVGLCFTQRMLWGVPTVLGYRNLSQIHIAPSIYYLNNLTFNIRQNYSGKLWDI